MDFLLNFDRSTWEEGGLRTPHQGGSPFTEALRGGSLQLASPRLSASCRQPDRARDGGGVRAGVPGGGPEEGAVPCGPGAGLP